jgi:hypothetical protein
MASAVGTAALAVHSDAPKAVASGVAAVVPVAARTQTLTVSGTLALTTDDLLTTASGCAGENGYDDITDGAAVTITDATGAVVALGNLAGSQLSGAAECDLYFLVSDVPTGKSFYGIEVSHRGSVKFTEAELASPVALTLGS